MDEEQGKAITVNGERLSEKTEDYGTISMEKNEERRFLIRDRISRMGRFCSRSKAACLYLILAAGICAVFYYSCRTGNGSTGTDQPGQQSADYEPLDLHQKFFEVETYGEKPENGSYGAEMTDISFPDFTFLSGRAYRGLTALNLSSVMAAQEDVYLNGIEYVGSTLEKFYLRYAEGLKDISGLGSLEKLKVLDLSGDVNIRTYEPLGNLTSLESLNISDTRQENEKEDAYWDRIKIIGNMPWLKQLNLKGNGLSDISFLSGMADLQVLELSDNHIKDFSPICTLPSLQWFSCRGNMPRDFTFLHGMNLRYLDLEKMYTLENCGDIARLKQLEQLVLVSCPYLTDISGLEQLEKLTDLRMEYTDMADLCCISRMRQLESLSLRNNGITEVSFLRGLTSLKSLGLGSSSLMNLDGLSRLAALESLRLPNAHALTDLSGLLGLHIKRLAVSHAPVTSLRGLENNQELLILECYGCPITDLSALKGCGRLESVWLTNAKVKDLSPLAGKKYMQKLYLDGVPASDFSVIKELRSLKELSVAKTGFSDLSVLEQLTELTYLDVRKTGLSAQDIRKLRRMFPDCEIVY